jgi:hypothetical protein
MSYSWGSSSTDANISASTISSSSSLASAAISNDTKAVTECGLTLAYNASSTKGAKVEILRTIDGGTTYQTDADSPYGFNLPFTANTTENYVFSVPGSISQFKVNLINLDTGHSITAATLKIRQATN